MLIGFDCPVLGRIPFEQCLKYCDNRCMPYFILKFLSKQRVATGLLSASKMSTGLRELFLMEGMDGYINPTRGESYIDALIGTGAHFILEGATDDGALSEVYLEDRDIGISGSFDFYDNKTKTLMDLKVLGNYKIKRLIAGEYEDYQTQLSVYAYLIEEKLKLPVDAIQLVCFAKEPAASLKKDKLDKITILELPRIPKDEMRQRILDKYTAFRYAIDNDICPPMCTKAENWNGRKCSGGWCSVVDLCKSYK